MNSFTELVILIVVLSGVVSTQKPECSKEVEKLGEDLLACLRMKWDLQLDPTTGLDKVTRGLSCSQYEGICLLDNVILSKCVLKSDSESVIRSNFDRDIQRCEAGGINTTKETWRMDCQNVPTKDVSHESCKNYLPCKELSETNATTTGEPKDTTLHDITTTTAYHKNSVATPSAHMYSLLSSVQILLFLSFVFNILD